MLLKVTDATADNEGFKDGTNTNDDYAYDANGNMTKDENKGITKIIYNHLNLPTQIIFGDTNQKITYLYAATGQKMQKQVTQNSHTATTQYMGGYQYSNTRLQFFPTAEGYVKNTIIQGQNSYDYIYNLTDHLGNIRMSFGLDPKTQQLVKFEENNYYPFGLKHSRYNDQLREITEKQSYNIQIEDIITEKRSAQKTLAIPSNPDAEDIVLENSGYQYKYNVKELQDELGLNMYDFGARNYDPALGRWMNIDPLAEMSRSFSPYTYAVNNPVYFIDPDGMMQAPNGGSGQDDEFNKRKKNDFDDIFHNGGGDAKGKYREDDPNHPPSDDYVNNSNYEPNYIGAESGGPGKGKGGKGGKKGKGAVKKSNVTVYVESDKLGHVYIEVNGTVFSFGRYNGSYSPASGEFGPVGVGVLLKKTHSFAVERMAKNPTSVYNFPGADANKTFNYLNNAYNSGTPNEYSGGMIIGTYSLLGNNCTTVTCNALQAGGVDISTIQSPMTFKLNMAFPNQFGGSAYPPR